MNAYRSGLAFCVAVGLVSAGVLIGNAWPVEPAQAPTPEPTVSETIPPDVTVAVCGKPVPAYTRRDICAARLPSGAWIISSPDNPSPALDAPVTR